MDELYAAVTLASGGGVKEEVEYTSDGIASAAEQLASSPWCCPNRVIVDGRSYPVRMRRSGVLEVRIRNSFHPQNLFHVYDQESLQAVAETVVRRYAGANLACLREGDLTPEASAEDRRREAACKRLSETTDTVAAISLASGFVKQSSFTRAFKSWTGLTPLEYRRMRRAGASDAVTSSPASPEES